MLIALVVVTLTSVPADIGFSEAHPSLAGKRAPQCHEKDDEAVFDCQRAAARSVHDCELMPTTEEISECKVEQAELNSGCASIADAEKRSLCVYRWAVKHDGCAALANADEVARCGADATAGSTRSPWVKLQDQAVALDVQYSWLLESNRGAPSYKRPVAEISLGGTFAAAGSAWLVWGLSQAAVTAETLIVGLVMLAPGLAAVAAGLAELYAVIHDADQYQADLAQVRAERDQVRGQLDVMRALHSGSPTAMSTVGRF